jgi:hypothetical protein
MKTILISLCVVALVTVARAAQDDQNKHKRGKEGQQEQAAAQTPNQVMMPKGHKKMQGGANAGGNANADLNRQRNFRRANKMDQGDAGSVGNGANAKMKSKFGSGNMANAKKFEKKKFNLQTNNTKVVINKYKTVKFNANYKIAGAWKWKGPKYAVFVNYHPIWQDQWWWTNHYHNIVFVYGGWYYWDANYWYPAWGYDPGSVYCFDGPIYASSPEWDPAQVVANVQSALQEEGYYQGEIDGVLGPQTRAALADYQTAQGLEPTGAVDEPTLETLGMA